MIGIFAEQLLAIVAAIVIFGTPGWALSRLLELHLRMPVVGLPAAWGVLGLAVWTAVLLPAFLIGVPILATLVAHVVMTVALVVWSRLRERRRGHAKAPMDAVSGWTVAVVALMALAALGLRTRIAFDSLFHVGLVRRIAQFDAPTFDNLDRVVGAGVNPAYALPTWQAAMAAIARVTGLDAATVLESMAVVGVLLAACAAGALGRAVSATMAGELAGVSAYAWLRVTFPRRELEGDGVAYASLPGNIALDVLLPLALVAAVLLMRGPGRRDGALAVLGAVSVVLLVVLHANYVVYLAVIGAGVAVWLLAAGPWSRRVGRRLGLVAATFAVPGLATLAVLLPVLMMLEHFGAPLEVRIDYHLTEVGGIDLIRPGHLYDWFAAPGLLGILLLPWAAWRARGVVRALIGGGALAVLAFALVPPLLDLLGASGSLTLGLRLPRPLGVLLIAAAAVALPDLVARVTQLASRIAASRGRAAGWGVRLAPLAVVFALSAAYGYPRVRREPPQYGWDWPTLVAVAGLVVVFVLAIRGRRSEDADAAGPGAAATGGAPRIAPRTMGLAMLAVAVAMLPSGVQSMRRAAWQSREVVAAYRADDLRCFDGVQAALRDLPAGAVLLTDPVTAYGAQALAPVQVAGDFKIWNGATDSGRIERRLQLLRATFDSQVGERAGAGLARLADDLDASYLLVSRGPVEPPLGSELGTYDAAGLRDVLGSGDIGAARIAAGEGRFDDTVEPEERAACELELWALDGSESELEYDRDGHHATEPGAGYDRDGDHVTEPGAEYDRDGDHVTEPGAEYDRDGDHVTEPEAE